VWRTYNRSCKEKPSIPVLKRSHTGLSLTQSHKQTVELNDGRDDNEAVGVNVSIGVDVDVGIVRGTGSK